MNSEGTEEGSLLKLLSRCITPFGVSLFDNPLPFHTQRLCSR